MGEAAKGKFIMERLPTEVPENPSDDRFDHEDAGSGRRACVCYDSDLVLCNVNEMTFWVECKTCGMSSGHRFTPDLANEAWDGEKE